MLELQRGPCKIERVYRIMNEIDFRVEKNFFGCVKDVTSSGIMVQVCWNINNENICRDIGLQLNICNLKTVVWQRRTGIRKELTKTMFIVVLSVSGAWKNSLGFLSEETCMNR